MVLEGSGQESREELARLSEEISVLRFELEEVQKSADDATEKLKEETSRVEKEKQALKEETSRVEKEKQALKEETSRVEKEKQALKEERDRVVKEKDALREEKDSALKEREELRQQNAQLQSDKDRLEKEREELRQQNAQLQEKLKTQADMMNATIKMRSSSISSIKKVNDTASSPRQLASPPTLRSINTNSPPSSPRKPAASPPPPFSLTPALSSTRVLGTNPLSSPRSLNTLSAPRSLNTNPLPSSPRKPAASPPPPPPHPYTGTRSPSPIRAPTANRLGSPTRPLVAPSASRTYIPSPITVTVTQGLRQPPTRPSPPPQIRSINTSRVPATTAVASVTGSRVQAPSTLPQSTPSWGCL